jgi:hypothetical protein
MVIIFSHQVQCCFKFASSIHSLFFSSCTFPQLHLPFLSKFYSCTFPRLIPLFFVLPFFPFAKLFLKLKMVPQVNWTPPKRTPGTAGNPPPPGHTVPPHSLAPLSTSGGGTNTMSSESTQHPGSSMEFDTATPTGNNRGGGHLFLMQWSWSSHAQCEWVRRKG